MHYLIYLFIGSGNIAIISDNCGSVQFSSVQSLGRDQLFASPRIAAGQASLCITSSWSLPKLLPIESVMPHRPPVAYWAPTDLGSSFQCPIFLPFHTVHGFSRQES